jgi:HAD-superfamily subfamily IIA hydrolase, TIGR01458
MQNVKGILLDIDGVLHVSMQPIKGARETLDWLTEHGYAYRFVTNTTTQARATLAQRLQAIGLPIRAEQLVTAPVATAAYVRQHFTGKRCWLITKGDTARDFIDADIELVTDRADVVVIGGAEELLTYETMNAAFRMIMDGAALLAMHMNRYWRTAEGLQLDSGPFVRALELATGCSATIIGKPEPAFFQQALHALGTTAEETIMLGDDIENDVAGAQRIGLRGVLVCTGKYQANAPMIAQVHPAAILPSIAELPSLLQL